MDLQQLIAFDKDLLLQWNGSDSLFWDGFMLAATSTIVWVPAGLVLLYVIFKNNTPLKALLILGMMALVIIVTSIISSGICKPYFSRLRPTYDPVIMYLVDTVNGYRGEGYSFLSSHAANSFSFSIFTSLLVKRRSFTFAVFTWAILHTYTRIYLGVHYPGDILFGALAGLMIGILMYALFSLLLKRIFQDTYYLSDRRVTTKGYAMSDLKKLYLVLIITILFLLFIGIWTGYTHSF